MRSKEYRSFYYDDMQQDPVTDDFSIPRGTEMTGELLQDLIDEHKESRLPRYLRLQAAAETRYLIFDDENKKADYKPDNRLAADMAQYILATFTGFYIGIPPNYRIEDKAQSEWLDNYNKLNVQDDVDAELAEMTSLYGNAFELLYQDENGAPRSCALSPKSCFVVYDNSVLHRPLYGVRYAYDEDDNLVGTFSDAERVYRFSNASGQIVIEPDSDHYFGNVPIIEYIENAQKRGVFEGVLNLIEKYNKALSEKANDIDYFADAYMVVEGMKLDEEEAKKNLREYRLINLWNDQEGVNVDVEFLAKPDSDISQEHFLDRLEALIYKLSMVPDISNEAFGTASGIALKMRLLPMSNLASKKDRKFKKSIMRRLELLANYPTTSFSNWQDVEVMMNRNFPDDLQSEAALAGSLSGVTSQETQLSVLSCVDDVEAEMSRINKEQDDRANRITGGYPTNRTIEIEEEE